MDFEAEGLFAGLRDEQAIAARRDLIEWLMGQGVSLEEIKRAIAEDRLTVLPVEREFGRNAATLNAHQVAERAGVDVDFLHELWRAVGLATLDYSEPQFTDDDVEAARLVKTFLSAGIPAHVVLEIARVLGRSMSALTAVVFDEVRTALASPEDNELELALKWTDAARNLAPMLLPLLTYVLRLHEREEIRQHVVTAADLASKGLPGARWISVCFIDVVGFTSLSEQLSASEVGEVAQRLSDYAATAAVPPVTLVKTIGDAAMLVSTEVDPLLDATFNVISMAEREREIIPQLRAGVAAGDAVRRAADWYGQPVNLANRVTVVARPGSVLTTPEVRENATADYRWSEAGRHRLKGVSKPVALFRVRPNSPEERP